MILQVKSFTCSCVYVKLQISFSYFLILLFLYDRNCHKINQDKDISSMEKHLNIYIELQFLELSSQSVLSDFFFFKFHINLILLNKIHEVTNMNKIQHEILAILLKGLWMKFVKLSVSSITFGKFQLVLQHWKSILCNMKVFLVYTCIHQTQVFVLLVDIFV